MYSTVEKVRREAWLEWNTNISDAEIESYMEEATAKILSYISGRYNISNLTWADFTGSQASTMLDLIEKLISAWMIMNSQNPGYESDGDRLGNWKILRWDTMLEDIISWKLKLLKVNGSEFALTADNSSGGYSYLPDVESTDDTFKINDTF